MAVFNCSTYENDEIDETVDFKVQTQTDNLYTGGFSVKDTLKIKGINGVNVVASDDTIVIGVNGTGSTGGGTSGDGTSGGGVDTTMLELSVEALEQSVDTFKTDLQDLSDRVSDLEQSGGDTGGSGEGEACNPLPEITPEDNGKVLGVVDGEPAWVEPTAGSDGSNGSNGSDGSDGSNGSDGADGSSCNCPNIIIADSKSALPDPATVPKNTIAFIPSEESGNNSGAGNNSGSSGFSLPVVELTTKIPVCSSSNSSVEVTLSAAESAALSEAAATGLPVVIKGHTEDTFLLPDFGLIANSCGSSKYLECGFCLTNAKCVVCYDGSANGWVFRLTYVGS